MTEEGIRPKEELRVGGEVTSQGLLVTAVPSPHPRPQVGAPSHVTSPQPAAWGEGPAERRVRGDGQGVGEGRV